MPHIKKLTPNLLVANVERSIAFYVDVLGFERGMTVPEQAPFVFASVTSGTVEIFFNDADEVAKEQPALAARPLRASATMFMEVDDVDGLHDRIKSRAKITMPLVTQWYGMREFGFEDPDGYVITFAQPVAAGNAKG